MKKIITLFIAVAYLVKDKVTRKQLVQKNIDGPQSPKSFKKLPKLEEKLGVGDSANILRDRTCQKTGIVANEVMISHQKHEGCPRTTTAWVRL